MPQPELTRPQVLALGVLRDGERSGREVRATLAEGGVRMSAPAFYHMMARLEDANLVEGWYAEKAIGDYLTKERRYRITDDGITLGMDAPLP